MSGMVKIDFGGMDPLAPVRANADYLNDDVSLIDGVAFKRNNSGFYIQRRCNGRIYMFITMYGEINLSELGSMAGGAVTASLSTYIWGLRYHFDFSVDEAA